MIYEVASISTLLTIKVRMQWKKSATGRLGVITTNTNRRSQYKIQPGDCTTAFPNERKGNAFVSRNPDFPTTRFDHLPSQPRTCRIDHQTVESDLVKGHSLKQYKLNLQRSHSAILRTGSARIAICSKKFLFEISCRQRRRYNTPLSDI